MFFLFSYCLRFTVVHFLLVGSRGINIFDFHTIFSIGHSFLRNLNWVNKNVGLNIVNNFTVITLIVAQQKTVSTHKV